MFVARHLVSSSPLASVSRSGHADVLTHLDGVRPARQFRIHRLEHVRVHAVVEAIL